MTDEEIKSELEKSLQELFAQDGDLLERNIAERAIAAKLIGHMTPRFQGYSVDAEYDKHGIDPKRLDLPAECHRAHVIPDIVVHRRGTDDFNLLAIEMKKETNTAARNCDKAKLRAMKRQLNYRAAVLLELPAGPGATQRREQYEWIA